MTIPAEVDCQKLKKKLPALSHQPYPGDIGKKILTHISAQAWEMWLDKQTMLINEKRINSRDPAAMAWLEETMLAYLFEDKEIEISGFQPPK